MSVFEYVFWYSTNRGDVGIVRADDEGDAANRILDYYKNLHRKDVEVTEITRLDSVDNDFGVIDLCDMEGGEGNEV